jgi:hypothetical protein
VLERLRKKHILWSAAWRACARAQRSARRVPAPDAFSVRHVRRRTLHTVKNPLQIRGGLKGFRWRTCGRALMLKGLGHTVPTHTPALPARATLCSACKPGALEASRVSPVRITPSRTAQPLARSNRCKACSLQDGRRLLRWRSLCCAGSPRAQRPPLLRPFKRRHYPRLSGGMGPLSKTWSAGNIPDCWR